MDKKEQAQFFMELLILLNKYNLIPIHNYDGFVIGRESSTRRSYSFSFAFVRELYKWLNNDDNYLSSTTVRNNMSKKLEEVGENVR